MTGSHATAAPTPLGIVHGPLTGGTVHLCLDMQNLLGPHSPWYAPWSERILPAVVRLAALRPDRTVFTRFVAPREPRNMPPTWRRYFERWDFLTDQETRERLFGLLPPLAEFVPPAVVLDKPVYSPFSGRRLAALLREWNAETLVISGAETDVCVLATVLDAVDAGYRVIVARDALCGSSDRTHDALLTFYAERLGSHVELAEVSEILAAWDDG